MKPYQKSTKQISLYRIVSADVWWGLNMTSRKCLNHKFVYSEIVLARHFAFIFGKRVFIDDDFSAALFTHSCVSDLEYDDITKLVDFYVKVL